jgi:hypothetical protein
MKEIISDYIFESNVEFYELAYFAIIYFTFDEILIPTIYIWII